MGLFHAVSAFCNAGFDLLGGRFGAFSSLAGYNDNPRDAGHTAALIVVGGLGFFVWEDIVDSGAGAGCRSQQDGAPHHRCADRGGALFFLMEEFDNPATLGDMPLWQKGLNALF